MMILKPRRWWMALWSREDQWVTWRYDIYHPVGISPKQFPRIMRHEMAHAKQQATTGFWWWVCKYVLSKAFRLDQEAQAIAVELRHTDPRDMESVLAFYCEALTGPLYRNAAKSIEEARELILDYYAKVDL